MRHAFFVGLFCFLAAPMAQAQDAALKPTRQSPLSLPGRVQLIEDDANAMLRVLFDGREVARCCAEEQEQIDCEVIGGDAAILPVMVVNEPAPLPSDRGAP